MNRSEFVRKMNERAIFSAISGQPARFVNRLTDQVKRAAEGPVTDGVSMYDPADPSVDDMEAIFVACTNGDAESYLDAVARIGDAAGDDDRAFFAELERTVCGRNEVELVEADPDEEDEDEEDEEAEVWRTDDLHSIVGYSVSAESAAGSGEDLIPLIQKIGIQGVKNLSIEFMAMWWELDDEQFEKGLCAIECYYRSDAGTDWIRSCVSLIPREQTQEFFESIIPDIVRHIDWKKICDTLDDPDHEISVTVGVPYFGDGE